MYLTCTYPTITSRSVPEVHLDGDEDSKHVTSPPLFFSNPLFTLFASLSALTPNDTRAFGLIQRRLTLPWLGR